MVYPDTFEGFMVTSHVKWSDFEKQEVSTIFHSCVMNNLLNPIQVQTEAIG